MASATSPTLPAGYPAGKVGEVADATAADAAEVRDISDVSAVSDVAPLADGDVGLLAPTAAWRALPPADAPPDPSSRQRLVRRHLRLGRAPAAPRCRRAA
ncbi:hypothetical protein, partial [Burkholderia pseudomallei]|uniref:hypothetical protein n=1 Tax=Burkholderia pseudomallei TaxID=28450 RepID=UPI00358FCB6C